MLTLLDPTQYPLVLPLFAVMDDQLAPLSLLHGSSRGEVYADDAMRPGAALLRVSHRYYLGGSPENHAFNEELHHLFTDRIFPAVRARGDGGFMVYYEDAGWGPVIEDTILAGCEIYPGPRQYYELDLDRPGWQPPSAPTLPDGLRLQAVDRALLERQDLTNLGELAEEMCSERDSVDEFLAKSFGMMILSETKVVTWCLSEYNLGERCEVGIATAEEYRRRGLSTLTGLAFIAQAQARGIRRIGWHCWTRNEGSVAAARRLNFSLVKDHQAYFVAVRPSE